MFDSKLQTPSLPTANIHNLIRSLHFHRVETQQCTTKHYIFLIIITLNILLRISNKDFKIYFCFVNLKGGY